MERNGLSGNSTNSTDPPWERKLFLDIIPFSAPGTPNKPLRILSTTYVNYNSLPSGAAANQENIGRWAAFICSKNPLLILEPHTAAFVHESKRPFRFNSITQAEYDSRYN